MDKVALVTGADRGLGLGLCQVLLESGWKVVAGRHLEWPELGFLRAQFPSRLHVVSLDVGSDGSVAESAAEVGSLVPHIDLLISNAAINSSHDVQSVRQALDFEKMQAEFNVNAVGAIRLVAAFLPLLDRGAFKRLCFVSSEAGSVAASTRTGWFGYCMSKAALNMAVKNMSNDLIGQGYSFRLYHPGWLRTYMQGVKNTDAHMEPEEGAALALKYFFDDTVPAEPALHCWDGTDMPW